MTERQDALHLGGLEDGGRFGSKTPILFFGTQGYIRQTIAVQKVVRLHL